MYQCNKCNARFDTPNFSQIPHYEVDTRIYETISICPECGSEDFEEVTPCRCGRNLIRSHEDFCRFCYEDVSDAIGLLQVYPGFNRDLVIELIESYIWKIKEETK